MQVDQKSHKGPGTAVNQLIHVPKPFERYAESETRTNGRGSIALK
jgi:hypothetical protein